MTPVKDWSLPCPWLLLPVDVLARGCSCRSMSSSMVGECRRGRRKLTRRCPYCLGFKKSALQWLLLSSLPVVALVRRWPRCLVSMSSVDVGGRCRRRSMSSVDVGGRCRRRSMALSLCPLFPIRSMSVRRNDIVIRAVDKDWANR